MCNPNIVCVPPSESTLTYTQLKSIKQGSTYFSWVIILECAWSPINIRTTEMQEEDAVWAEDAFLAEDAWMATLLFHQASSTHRPTPAAWQTQSQIIHNWELDTGKCLSSIILPISQDFKSTMWPISSQLTYREMCTQSNSPYQKLQSGFTIADPDTSMIS